ncbi:MAG: hypothetical protein GWN01_01110, partial [Nitrosopumilaceae archaeon]|nr:hypothetical protein [Nitrosopumilaceae archaeon]NIX60179.1 hypothetical protein [Nitrosopumilaceae archaeon]
MDAIVEGSALLVDERVRINAQLINAKTDEHLWAEEYERSFQDILLLQKEVARAIASEIRIVMTPDEETQLNRIQPINPEAKKAYLKGLHFIYRWTEADVKKGIYFFKETINQDSLYAPAYVGLSIGYLNLMYHNWMSPNEGLLLMEMAAKKAIEIDDTLAEAYGILGIVKYIHHWDWKGAELQFKQSLAHNSGSANVHLFYGWFLSLMKRHEEAIEELNLAKELDPLSIRIWESA